MKTLQRRMIWRVRLASVWVAVAMLANVSPAQQVIAPPSPSAGRGAPLPDLVVTQAGAAAVEVDWVSFR